VGDIKTTWHCWCDARLLPARECDEQGEQMINFRTDTTASAPDVAPRRGLVTRLAAAAALGLTGLSDGRAEAATSDGPDWPGKLSGRHRQVVDAVEVNDGFPLAFVYTFLITNPSPGAATAVIVVRHMALTLALNDAVWAKYKIGESLKIIDPETKDPAVKNPYFHSKPGVLMSDDFAIDRLLANGVIFGACNIALHALSKKLAANAGVSADDAAKEWTANVIPGIALIPSGTWGVNRAQEAGCTYCSGS
jgi:hypothetical protein